MEAHIIICPGGCDAARLREQYENLQISVCETPEELDARLAQIAREAAYFVVKTRQGRCVPARDSILYCQADGHRFRVYLADGRVLTSTTTRLPFARSMEPLLRDSRFVQCSASAVVNWNYVSYCKDSRLYLKEGSVVAFPAKWHARTLASAGLDGAGENWLCGE